MERFLQRENVSLGHALQGFCGNSPKTAHASSEDLDFSDVFGGPPRRFSMQEVRMRYSFGETVESGEERGSSPWSSLNEKPAFGEEIVARRRHQGDDFFDDIFRADDSYSSPRRTDSVFGSNPGSRIMSPARPLPPKAEPFGASLPAQFSLPAKLTKAMEFPAFTSRNHGQYRMDGSTSGSNSPHSLSSLSRFSNQAIRSKEIRNEVQLVYRQSPLSHETLLASEDSPSTVTSVLKDNIVNLKKDTGNVDSSGNQFHFSIYKWAGKGVPMLMSVVAENNLKSKDKSKYVRNGNSNGKMKGKSRKQGLPAAEPKSLKMTGEKEGLRSKEKAEEKQNSIEQALNEILESKSQSIPNDTVVSDGARNIGEKIVKEVPLKIEEPLGPKVKPLHAFLSDEAEQPGNNRNKTKTPKGIHANHDRKSWNKIEGIKIDSDNVTVEKSSLQHAAVDSGVTPGKSGVRGKVREFVQIFNQEADSRTKADGLRRSQSCRWKTVGIDQKQNEVNENAAKEKEKVNLHNVDKKPDVSLKVDEKLNNDEVEQHSPKKGIHSSTNLKKAFSSETLHRDSNFSVENSDDPLEDNFVVQELSDDHEKVTQSGSSEDKKAIDAKIRQWSVGKKGNIRSLLSTLQYVLWPGSGWKPVPLVDLIEANSVKRTYQKALLHLHPDKLQQKGAASDQKYTAEKVFDILQDAWDHFNTTAPL